MQQLQTLLVHKSHDAEGTGRILCDLDPLDLGVKVKSVFFGNAFS